MRRLCHCEWNWQGNWQSVNHIPGIHDNGPRDHGRVTSDFNSVYSNQHMTFDPIRDGPLGAASPKNYRCVYLTIMHLYSNFKTNPSRNVASRAHTRQQSKYDLWPCKRRTTRASITKNYRRVEFTKIHLHRKFESNPSRNGAARVHTKMWRGGGTLLNPKYPPAVSCRGIQLVHLYRSTEKKNSAQICTETKK